MRKLLLSRVDKDSTNNFTLKIGEHVIGRGPLLQCSSKKVSRNHALIRVTENDGVTLTATHHNPCFYLSKETKHMAIIKNGTTIQLHNDDQIALLSDEYWFKIEIVDLMDSTDSESNITITETTKNKKREHSDDSSNENSKKQKSEKSNNLDNENEKNLLNAGHSSTVNCDIDITLNIESNKNSPLVSNLNNSGHSETRSESPDFLNSQFNPSPNPTNESVENVLTNGNDFAVFKGNVPSTSKEDDQSASAKTDNVVNSQTVEELNNELLETLNDLRNNSENSNDQSSANDTKQIGNSNNEEKNPTQTADEISESIMKSLAILKEHNQNSEQSNGAANVEIKEEPLSQEEGSSQQNIVTQPIDELYNVAVKQEPEETTSTSSGDNNVKKDSTDVEVKKEPKDENDGKDECDKKDSSTNTSQPSTSNVARERCWYGATCYRKNPQHKIQFSHPGDADYGDINQRPICPFGSTCYRRNPRHYQQYEHATPPNQNPDPNNKKTKRQKKIKAPKQDYESDLEKDDYDFTDPFLDDGSSDEYQLSGHDDDNDDDEDISQEVDEENTEENKLLLKEAKKFTKKR